MVFVYTSNAGNKWLYDNFFYFIVVWLLICINVSCRMLTKSDTRCMGKLEHCYVEDVGKIYDLITCMKCNYSCTNIVGEGHGCEDYDRCSRLIQPESDTHVHVMKDEHSRLPIVSCSGDSVTDDSASGDLIVDEACMYSMLMSVEDSSTLVTAILQCSHDESDMGQLDGNNIICGKFKRSSTTDCLDLSHESLKHARRKFVEFMCCPTCHELGYEIKHVEGLKDVLLCSKCNNPFGLDDTINYYDLLHDLEQGQFTVEPCKICGNMDANKFNFVVSNECTDTVGTFDLQCMVCCNVQLPDANSVVCEKTSSNTSNETVNVVDDLAGLEDMDVNLIQCPICENSTKDLFDIDTNEAGDILSVKCFKCNHRLIVPRTKCACQDLDCHEVIYDDVGYLEKVVCKRCHAQQEFDARFSTPRGDGDGSSLGRTQIASLAMLKQGDHIAWHQILSYWHHAIVIYVDERYSKITVINYDGPDVHKGT